MVKEAERIINSDKGEVQRIELPSGGWWEFYVPTKHKHVKAFRKMWREIPENVDQTDYAMLFATSAWSFAEAVTMEALDELDAPDSIVATRFFNDNVLGVLNPLPSETPNDSL